MNSRSQTSECATNSGLILNVNDDDGNRFLVSEILRRGGFTVEEAINGTQALEKVTTATDVVILDVNLPDIDGFEVCRRIKGSAATRSVLVLMLSAQSVELTDRVTGLEEGADGYLVQPVQPAELVAVVKSLLRLRKAEQAHACEAHRAKLTADFVVTLNDSQPLKVDLQHCVAALTEWPTIDAAAVWVNSPDEQSLRMVASVGVNEVEVNELVQEIGGEIEVTLPLNFDNESAGDEDERSRLRGAGLDWMSKQGIRSGISYPLIVDDHTVGLLEVYSRTLSSAELMKIVDGPAATLGLGIHRKQTGEALRASEEISQRRQNRVWELEQELGELERLARSSSTRVASQAYGSLPLRESHAKLFEDLVEEFREFLKLALEQRGHRVDHQLAEKLRQFSDKIAFFRAGPRDIIEIYSDALQRASSDTMEQKKRAFVEEGRLLVLELMGNVLSYYRTTSLGAVRSVPREHAHEDTPKGAGDE